MPLYQYFDYFSNQTIKNQFGINLYTKNFSILNIRILAGLICPYIHNFDYIKQHGF